MYAGIDSSTTASETQLDDTTLDQASFLYALRYAIEHDELNIEYQPRRNIASDSSHIFEALVRWNRPGSGVVYPEAFIDSAIEHGLIFAHYQWVFRPC